MHSQLAACGGQGMPLCTRCAAAAELERLTSEVEELRAERVEFLGETIPAEYYRGIAEGRAEAAEEIERLRSQVAELLPYATELVTLRHRENLDGYRFEDRQRAAHYAAMVERIAAGEFDPRGGAV